MKNDELMDFVILKPRHTNYKGGISLRIYDKKISLTTEAVEKLGSPDYINIFVDEKTRRVMIKGASADMDNIYKLNRNGSKSRRTSISNTVLIEDMKRIFGRTSHIIRGHVPAGCERTLIFQEGDAA